MLGVHSFREVVPGKGSSRICRARAERKPS
jgi:hypothetical protein